MSEPIVQLIFAALFFPLLSIGVYFRLQANKQQDHFERMKNEGRITFLTLRICGGILWIMACLFPWFPGMFQPVRYEPLFALQIVGAILSLLSIPMGVSVFTNIGKNITDTVETRKHHQLVTSGIYRYIRHPLYTTGILFFVGLGMLSSNWLILLLSMAVLISLSIRTVIEEEKLIQEFGDQYTQYARQTGKFFPKLM
ncbi:MAG: isoprenylcysteine carboxylmethyltransferase family protein [Bacteroidota bacterium]|jgi:protein-S-isoprenylcysteine O-methyltransferase Ste14